MVQMTILIILVFLSSIFAFDFLASASSAGSIVLDETDDVEIICAARRCIRKCCPKDKYFYIESRTCESFEGNLDFTNISVYDDYDYTLKINKTLSDIFLLVPGKFFEVMKEESFKNETFIDNAYILSDLNINTYLIESGKLFLEIPNSHRRFFPINYFCIEYEIGTTRTPKYWSVLVNDNIPKSNTFSTIALLVSSVFLFIVLFVYIILPELRNLVGIIPMIYVFCLMDALLILSYMLLVHSTYNQCLHLTAVIYFFFLAAFCWMDVMSFDVWWTYRSSTKAKSINRRGQICKFALYCLYACGIPLLMTAKLVLINETDLTHMPWFIKPQIGTEGCFLVGGQKLLYMYMPILIFIIFNWLFLLMTAFKVWRLTRGTYVQDLAVDDNSAVHHKLKKRLKVYIQLSIIMFIDWILEIVNFLTSDLIIMWKIRDAYDFLMGFGIFLVFLCNEKNYRKLQSRYCRYFNFKPSLNNTSNHSQDTPL